MTRLALTLIAALATTPALAQQSAEAFEAETRAAAPMAGESYGLVRCAAMFRSITLAIGPDLLGPERVAGLSQVEQRFGVAAAMVRMEAEAGLDQEGAINAVLNDIEAITPLYLNRYDANRDATGHAWSGDEMLAGDRSYCQALIEAMS